MTLFKNKTTSSKLATVAILFGLMSGAAAQAATCPVYEFAELQTYTEKELHDKASEFITLAAQIGPANMRESQNCFTQFDRVERVIKTKEDARKTQATPPAK